MDIAGYYNACDQVLNLYIDSLSTSNKLGGDAFTQESMTSRQSMK